MKQPPIRGDDSMRILYVEDDPQDADLTLRTLLRHDPTVSVDTASSLATARSRLAEPGRYDLLLSDVGLPDGSGLELVSEVRERRLPLAVVMLTGTGDVDTVVAALKAGADDYLVKGASLGRRLPSTLASALARFRADVARKPSILRLLYVEADSGAAAATRRHLEKHSPNIRLEVVPRTDELMRRLLHAPELPSPCDVLLIECRMEGDASLEVIKSLLDEGRLDVPMVMLGAAGDEQLAAHALRLGANVHYLVKHAGYLNVLPATLENAHRSALLAREERALRESQERLVGVIESAMDGVVCIDAEHRIVLFNPAAETMFGCAREQALGQRLEAFMPERYRGGHAGWVSDFGRTGVARRHMGSLGTVFGVRRNGEEFPIEASISQTRASGQALYTVILRDITERTRDLELLRDSDERFRQLAENIQEVFWITDPAKNEMIYVSPAYEAIWGRSRDGVYANPRAWLDAVHAEDRERVQQAALTRQVEGSYDVQYRIVRPDGEVRWVQDRAFPVRDAAAEVYRIVGVAEDITERKRAERQLEEEKALSDTLLASLPGIVYVIDRDGRLVRWNQDYEKVVGRSGRELLGADALGPIVDEDKPELAGRIRAVLESGVFEQAEGRVRDARGELRDYIFSAQRVEIGGAPFLVGTGLDVTDRKRAQEALRASDERFRRYFDLGVVGLAITSPGRGWLEVNDQICTILGYEREELLQKDWTALTHPDDLALDVARFNELSAGDIDGYSLEKRFLRKDGRTVNAMISVKAVRRPDGAIDYFVALLQDITDQRNAEAQQRELEAQLRQAQKMEAVGRLAGGVAHDFNNMLNVILGYAELALRKLSPVDPVRKNLNGIRAAAERSADLTRQLLAFSRRQTIAPRVLDLNAQLTGMESLLRRIIGEDVELAFLLREELWPVSMDPSQLDQVLANLAVNARDAMPEGGRLSVATRNVTLDEAYCRVHTDAQPGDYAQIAVSDSGCGMDAPTLERAFEPFFTTKPEGKGTGLGLAMIYGIVRQNGGSVKIYSEAGRGTTIRLYLPRFVGEGSQSEPVVETATPLHRGHETILLVEDEPSLRELAQELLQAVGYSVLTAASPGEAISLCEKGPERIDLLLTDVVMPVMNGKELSERIRVLKPGVKVLFMSGYTDDAIAHRGVLEPGVQFLEKPFTLDSLSRKVREALGE